MRRLTPTWGAASPPPELARMVGIIASTSFTSPSPTLVTVSETRRSFGSPILSILSGARIVVGAISSSPPLARSRSLCLGARYHLDVQRKPFAKIMPDLLTSPVDSHELSELGNGIKVLSVNIPHTRAATFAIYLDSGARYERDELVGISHFAEHIVFKGTRKWPTAKLISEEVEGVGGSLNAATGKELVTYWARVPEERLELAAEVVCSLVRDALLDPGEVEKERRVLLEELDMSHD